MTFQSTLISCNLCILNAAIFLTLENIRKDDQEWNGESRDTDNCRHKRHTGRRKTNAKSTFENFHLQNVLFFFIFIRLMFRKTY